MNEKRAKLRRTHTQIASALKKEALRQGLNINDAYGQFFREVFLSRLMEVGEGWVLKGGTNIYCRILGARQTMDLDLYRHADPTSARSAAELLVELMDGEKAGPYTFVLGITQRKTMAGPVENERVMVNVIHGVGNQFSGFNIDVSGDLQVSGAVEEVTVHSSFDLSTEFQPHSFRVFSYPMENQIADKVAALYVRYGESPPGRASTRYHDFYDVALIASNHVVSADGLRRALEQQSKLREMTLPQVLAEPEPGWGQRYEEKAKRLSWGESQLCDFATALEISGRLLDPVLAGDPRVRGAFWDPSNSAWKDGR